MKLFIPACGDRITLLKLWEFDLYLEPRNIAFAKVHELVDEKFNRYDGYLKSGNIKKVRATVPAGTVLECDRVYIRLFSKSALDTGRDFDSITWKVMKGDKPARHQRFWAKLPDCYDIEYDLPLGSLYRDRVKAIKLIHET